MTDPLESIRKGTAWDEFCDSLKQAGEAILRPGSPTNDFDRAEGYRYLSRLTRLALEKFVEHSDPLTPRLYQLSHETAKIGVDNPDSKYLNAVVSGEHEYRIRGQRGTEPYLSFGVYFGDYGKGGRSGCSGYLESEDIQMEADGSFELILSQKPQPNNWLKLEPDSHQLVVRRNLLDHETERLTELSIERIGGAGTPEPLDPAALAAGLQSAARYVAGTANNFCIWAEDWVKQSNTILALDDSEKERQHGDRNFRMLMGYWELAPDEALVIEIEPPECVYWNIELCNHWLESLDYRYHPIHINKHTAVYDGRGAARVVIAHRDPGVPNWLDTAGHERGTLGMRWGKAKQHPVPVTRVVKFEEVAAG